MKRDLYRQLAAWKSAPKHKPVLLLGARQTGKTYLLKEFGTREFEQCIYCNFEEDPHLNSLFTDSLTPVGLIDKLSLYTGTTIHPGKDLLIFDEIQSANNALASLKYFCEEMPALHCAAAGSLLGVKTSVPKTFPVGKVAILQLAPMTFGEFLSAAGRNDYREMLVAHAGIDPLPEALHLELIALLKRYYLCGGMPEAVASHLNGESWTETRAVQKDLLRTYLLDFAKHASTPDIPKLSLLWDSIPLHLARENKRFIFSQVAKSARAREYAQALRWLADAGLIHQAWEVEKARLPLAGYAAREIFKVYLLDVGLLAAMTQLDPALLLTPAELFATWHGAFVENYVAQQLCALREQPLYYWKSAGNKAEVDFLLEEPHGIIPLEVKAGINPRSKSLRAYAVKNQPPLLARTTLLNFRRDRDIVNIPLYALGELPRLLRLYGQ